MMLRETSHDVSNLNVSQRQASLLLHRLFIMFKLAPIIGKGWNLDVVSLRAKEPAPCLRPILQAAGQRSSLHLICGKLSSAVTGRTTAKHYATS